MASALHKVEAMYLADALELLDSTRLMHVLLLVALILFAGAIVVFLFRPFQNRIRQEMFQVADVLSQLPADVDVEGMVLAAVVGNDGE